MSVSMKLHRHGPNEVPSAHFERCVAQIKRVLEAGHRGRPNVSEDDLYAEKYLAYNINRKAVVNPDSPIPDSEKESKALANFLARESVNRRINQVKTWGYNRVTDDFETEGLLDRELLLRARDIIRELIGEAPSLRQVLEASAFGNGASATLRRCDAQAQKKFVRGISTTSSLAPFIPPLVEQSAIWLDVIGIPKRDTYIVSPNGKVSLHDWSALKRVAGGVMRFVEKQYDIKRIIVLEPELNGYLQKGVGKVLRAKLARRSRFSRNGMCLDTSGDLNSSLAQAGSEYGHLATVDAESASDSITLALCELLFPDSWYHLFCLLRSPYVVLPNGKCHRLQMMSGMGNGFTFELESVVFYAIGLACAERSSLPFATEFVSIHGDDLIVPSDVFDLVDLAYKSAGVVVNRKKSFSEGPFRESCGGHFYNGQSVKPFFRKHSTGHSRGDWFWLANSLQLWLSERNASYLAFGRGKELLQVLKYLRWYASSGVPSRWYVPALLSRRSGLYSEPQQSRGPWYRTRCVVDVPRTEILPDHMAYIGWLHTPTVSATPLEILTRNSQKTDAYTTAPETDERERNQFLTDWPNLPELRGMTTLWSYVVDCETRHV